jgi:4-amino-4-deoxy-L-arabinose transferase-like glycosyltransferase
MLSKLSNSKLITSLTLFLLALVPRLPDLGRFLTADEFLWVDRSRNFLAALTNPAWRCTTPVEAWEYAQGLACTLRTGHPGVTTMWTGSFGLWLRWLLDGRPAALHAYVVGVSTNPLDAGFVAPERLGTVLITSAWVVAVYWLARRLFGGPVALITALLLALDPFHIALSRVIHHDALGTTFMTLSALTALIYWGQQPGRKWLLLSGALGGLGFLSKSPAMFLMPFVAGVGLWFFWQQRRGGQPGNRPPLPAGLLILILDGLLWFAAAIAVVFALWPAMWVIPRETVETVFFIGSKYATGGHAKGNYFWGVISNDPGWLFYPVTWLYRASPPVLVGVAVALALWAKQLIAWRQKKNDSRATSSFILHPSSFPHYLPLILFFLAGFYLLMTIGEKKQDRYFLPAYPWLTMIAAYGLVAIFKSQIANGKLPSQKSPVSYLQSLIFNPNPLKWLLCIVLLVNGALVYSNYPYYFTYYNPLLGGIRSAANALTIGWGEGLDLAAAYLNQKPDSATRRVSSWYESTFAPFYHGPTISYSKEKGKALAGDYAVFYINQTQRRFPDDLLFDYFDRRFKPEKVITLHGLDYAWIYPSLGVDHYVEDQTYTGIASLLAWQWAAGDQPLTPGQPATFELWWEYFGKLPAEPFFFRLVDAQSRVWSEGASAPVPAENPPPAKWQAGEIVMERGVIIPPAGTPPGQYRLLTGFYTQAVAAGELLFDLPEDESIISVAHPAAVAPFSVPAQVQAVNQPLGQALTLLGANWPAQALLPGTAFPLELYWRVNAPWPAAAPVHVALMDEAGDVQQAWFNLTLAEILNPENTTWQPGDILHTRWQLDLLPQAAPGVYHFELVEAANTSQTLPFGRLKINP